MNCEGYKYSKPNTSLLLKLGRSQHVAVTDCFRLK